MNLFRRPDYKSETTLFIEQLKKDEPRLVAEQRRGLRSSFPLGLVEERWR